MPGGSFAAEDRFIGGGTNTNIFEYIEKLPANALDRLYGKDAGEHGHGPWTCRAILQSLPQLSKQYIMRLLFVKGYVDRGMIKSWVKKEYHRVHAIAFRKLLNMRVLVQNPTNSAEFQLNPPFRENLQQALCATDKTPWQWVGQRADKYPPTVAKIEQSMHSRWQGLLYFIVAPFVDTKNAAPPPEQVVNFMQESGLMTKGSGNRLKVTDKGYEFLLKETHVQAWVVVHALIDGYGRSNPGCRDDLLAFLFQLSYCKVGDNYPIEQLTPPQQDLVKDFVDLGLLFKRKAKSSRFYPTSIAINLIFGAMGDIPQPQALVKEGKALLEDTSIQIIVQTNFQVVCYSRSNLHFAMLSLFTELRARLPNAIIGAITRESMRQALAMGIGGRQVLDFLKWHAHPTVRRRSPVVPENVADQERDRMSSVGGVLLDLSRGSEESFREVVGCAMDVGGCLWSSPLVDPEGGSREEKEGGLGQGGLLMGRPPNYRMKLLVVTPEIAEQVSLFAEERT